MTIFYSESTKGFYDTEFHNKAQIPVDAIELSVEDHTKLLDEQSLGKQITVVGGVVTTKALVLTEDQRIALERQWRNIELIRADLELNKVQDADPKAVGSVSDWRAYRKNLRALPDHPDFPSVSARPVAPDA